MNNCSTGDFVINFVPAVTPHNYSKLRFGFFYFFFLSSVKKEQNINLLKMLFRMFSPPSVPMKCTAQGDSLHTNNGPVTIFNKTLNPICALVFILTQLLKVLLKPPSSFANFTGVRVPATIDEMR